MLNQSVFLLSDKFFDFSHEEIVSTYNDIYKKATTEKICITYDPFSEKLFKDILKIDKEIFGKIFLSFFQELEKYNKNRLKWNNLSEDVMLKLNSIMDLIYLFENEKIGIYSFGVFPVENKFKVVLFYFVSPYEDLNFENKFYLIKKTDYEKCLKNLNNLTI
jgi:hypothetical protein